MNLFELLIFVLVTGTVGAGVGAIVGFFSVGVAHGLRTGAFVGPIAAGMGLVVYSIVARYRKAQRQNPK